MVASNLYNDRREDSTATAGRVHDRLGQSFGRKTLFMDVDHIPPGVDFVTHLNNQVASCDPCLGRWGADAEGGGTAQIAQAAGASSSLRFAPHPFRTRRRGAG